MRRKARGRRIRQASTAESGSSPASTWRSAAPFLLYAGRLAHGRIEPRSHPMQWHAEDERVNTVAALEAGLKDRDVRAALARLAPAQPECQRLRCELAATRRTTVAGGAAPQLTLLELNVERWRWLPRSLGPRHLLVNIPDFRLRAVETGREVLSMRVVVGKPGNATPVLSDTMTTVPLNP